MESVQDFLHEKTGVRPHQIIFEKENAENTYVTWADKRKPRIRREDGITQEEFQILTSRWEEMLSLAEGILWKNYLNPQSGNLLSEVDCFPDIRYLTGNYYVEYVNYGYVYRDKKHRPYQIKEGRLRHQYHNGKEWVSQWLPLNSSEITRYYQIFLSLRLTGNELGYEDDYMGLDLTAEFVKLDDPLEFEILSHNVI